VYQLANPATDTLPSGASPLPHEVFGVYPLCI
jgi:hypothetical protein